MDISIKITSLKFFKIFFDTLYHFFIFVSAKHCTFLDQPGLALFKSTTNSDTFILSRVSLLVALLNVSLQKMHKSSAPMFNSLRISKFVKEMALFGCKLAHSDLQVQCYCYDFFPIFSQKLDNRYNNLLP